MPSEGGNKPGPTLDNPAHTGYWAERMLEEKDREPDGVGCARGVLFAVLFTAVLMVAAWCTWWAFT